VWRSLVHLHELVGRRWLDLLDDEIEPAVLGAVEPDLVVWASLWPSRPDDQIRFDLRPGPSGTALRWTVSAPGDAPAQTRITFMRYRMNVLINERLRLSFGQ
jgi:hypothetical protein